MGPSKIIDAGIIDADVHPYVRGGWRTLSSYMPREARSQFDGHAAAEAATDGERPAASWRPGMRWNHPNRYTNPNPGVKVGVLRPDATPPSGDLPGTDPAFVVTDLLDRDEVDAAILLPVASAGGGHVESIRSFTDPAVGAAYVSAVNEYFIETWLPVDPRFGYALQLLTRDPDAAVAEIRRHQGRRGVVACFLPLLNILMGERYYYPIYAAAEECELPIIIHPFGAEGNFLGGPLLAGGVPATYLERHIDLAQVGQANVASMVFQGVFERFPRLRLVLAEFGFTWIAPLMWRLDRDWRWVRNEVPAFLKMRPSEYIVEKVRLTTQPLEEPEHVEHLRAVMEMVHADRTILFSSDYPHWDNDNPHTVLRQLPAGLRRRIYRENALETFGPRLRTLVDRTGVARG
jgi:predicted TIM-barrel fold metal-dependent hydrolase